MFKGQYIGGEFSKLQSDKTWEVFSPSDLSDCIVQAEMSESSVDEACTVAFKAYEKWKYLSLEERKNFVMRLRTAFKKNQDLLAEVISRETGKPLWESLGEAKGLVSKIDVTIEHSLQIVKNQVIENVFSQTDGEVHYKSRGVSTVIGAFNFPMHLSNGHIIPALLLGNTVVLKPSERTPLSGQLFAEMFHQAGFPKGVFNMIQGDGLMSARLVTHPLVSSVLFTGSYNTGLKIKKSLIDDPHKILALEMGGKNTFVVWSDASLKQAVYEAVVSVCITAGQRCSCTSQIVVHDDFKEQFIDLFTKTLKNCTIGHWKDNVFMGPVIDAESVKRHFLYQDIAVKEGGEILYKGESVEAQTKGHFVSPSVIYFDSPLEENAQYPYQELFTPQVAIYSVQEFGEVKNIINRTGYGLVASLFTTQKELYKQALYDWKVGLLNINRGTTGASGKLPFGGMGKSGNDRPTGNFAVQYCSSPVACLVKFSKEPSPEITGLPYPK